MISNLQKLLDQIDFETVIINNNGGEFRLLNNRKLCFSLSSDKENIIFTENYEDEDDDSYTILAICDLEVGKDFINILRLSSI